MKALDLIRPPRAKVAEELANAYGVRALPASFIVDRQEHLAALALGPRAWDSAASQALIGGLSR
jgi:hypothetical protein